MSCVAGRIWKASFTWAVLLGCVALVIGCEYHSTALEDRMKDFQYSTDTLAQEMVTRLKSAHLGTTRKNQAANSRASQVSAMEADRGGDGDRPDPHSVEVIAADCAAKVRLIQEQGKIDNAADAVIEQMEAATEIKQDVREAFSTALREELADSSS